MSREPRKVIADLFGELSRLPPLTPDERAEWDSMADAECDAALLDSRREDLLGVLLERAHGGAHVA